MCIMYHCHVTLSCDTHVTTACNTLMVVAAVQALNSILSALASLEESGMSADEIRQLLRIPQHNKSTKPSSSDSSTVGSSSSSSGGVAPRQAPAQQHQQQQHDLRSAARQLGQLSPELAQEWYDRAVRQSLAQVRYLLTHMRCE